MAKFSTQFFTYCILFLLAQPATAQVPASLSSADMYLALRKLNVLGSVLYVAAHPDDENTRLITYLSKDKLYRTGYLSLTRGDGGQNLIGDEQGIELGLIRTQELLAARRIDGGEQFFSRAYDFGYSKTPGETFVKWDKEKILSDVVWVIRKFQPDVIITRFPTTGEGGHGHHTGSAILANEAFTAAADPSRFPEQLKYVQVWQAKRVLWNTFNFGAINTIAPDQLRVDVGGYNPLLGKSYGEIAAESRSQHKSQGFGVPASRGEAIENFKTTAGSAPAENLMDGVELDWKRVPGANHIGGMIDSLTRAFDFLHPEKSVKGLVNLFNAINALPDSYWKRQKRKETKALIQQCSGLFIDATVSTQFAVQTDSLKINFSLNNRLAGKTVLKEISVPGAFTDSSFNQSLSANKNFNFAKTFIVRTTTPITQPYWLEKKMEEGYYNVSSQEIIGTPDIEPAYLARVTVTIEGEDFWYHIPVRYRFTDPVKGEMYEPLVILPPVELKFVNENNFSINDTPARAQAYFKTNRADSVFYSMYVAHSDKWKTDRDQFVYGTYHNPANYLSLNFTSKAKGIKEEALINAKSKEGTVYNKYRQSIQYAHIPYIVYYKNASTHLVKIDLKTYNKKIGYIIGAGDKVPQALDQMGYEVTLLTDKELGRNNLNQFDAIITGVRAHNTNDWMNTHYDKLMRYVNEGGNLIVQYNTSSNIGPVKAKMGPYPFDISRTRVTDENAAVTFLKPQHPVLNFPNKITQDDFMGWIQERSIYHAAAWDTAHFEAIFSMRDSVEKGPPDAGSLIISKYGKGYFTYTGIVFFRELPAGVPGAYRLLANLIALNRKKN